MKRFALLVMAGVCTLTLNAQKIKLTNGSLSALVGVKEVGVIFSYENMRVGKMTESEYLADRSAKYNEKEPGKGDQWKKSWVNDREARFEPKFIELLNKYGKNWTFKKGTAPVYIKFHTIFTEPGFNVGVMRKDAVVNGNIHIYSGNSEVATLTLVGAYGGVYGGFDFDTGVRISESYAIAGKGLAKFLAKKAK